MSAMAWDPLNSARNRDASEYGGRAGKPQPLAEGHTVLTPQEKRTMVTREALASAGVMEDLPPTDEHFDAVLELASKRVDIYRSGHTLDDALS
jgi:hypothetical protein